MRDVGLVVALLSVGAWCNILMGNVKKLAKTTCTFKVRVLSTECDEFDLPVEDKELSKGVLFPVVPQVGMEVDDWGVYGAIITRVVVNKWNIEVYGEIKVAEKDFKYLLQNMESDGWHESYG